MSSKNSPKTRWVLLEQTCFDQFPKWAVTQPTNLIGSISSDCLIYIYMYTVLVTHQDFLAIFLSFYCLCRVHGFSVKESDFDLSLQKVVLL